MDKRQFIRFGLAGSAAGIFVPKAALAAGMDKVIHSKFAGGLYYTEHAFGRWNKGLADHHLPQLDKEMSGGAASLHVATAHPMGAYGHYIIKHQLHDHNLKFMQEHLYNPTTDAKPETTFDLGAHRGLVYVLTICNVHDTWINLIEV
ncbi:MAG TPA: desulfoferrodoxin family protein [Burkholderiales bacterium]|nr:desulfoferrodoxin family protein [Burkholderiales bacterium]